VPTLARDIIGIASFHSSLYHFAPQAGFPSMILAGANLGARN
jgi:hypothetical protein